MLQIDRSTCQFDERTNAGGADNEVLISVSPHVKALYLVTNELGVPNESVLSKRTSNALWKCSTLKIVDPYVLHMPPRPHQTSQHQFHHLLR